MIMKLKNYLPNVMLKMKNHKFVIMLVILLHILIYHLSNYIRQ